MNEACTKNNLFLTLSRHIDTYVAFLALDLATISPAHLPPEIGTGGFENIAGSPGLQFVEIRASPMDLSLWWNSVLWNPVLVELNLGGAQPWWVGLVDLSVLVGLTIEGSPSLPLEWWDSWQQAT